MIDVSPAVRGLIFDCDGTLADTMTLHMDSWEKAFRERGEPFRPEFLDPLRGMKEEEIVSLYNRQYHRDLDPREVVDRKHVFFRRGVHRVKPILPVTDLVHQYRDVLPMAVVSGGKRGNVALVLDNLAIRTFFAVILTADDPIAPKPAPDLFLEAARRLNVDPGRCQVFEDGDLGLEAARRAGMTATDVRRFSQNRGTMR